MLKNIIPTLCIILFLYSCDYTPLYSNKNLKKINLQILKIEGDRELNKNIISDLNKYFNRDGKEIKININSKYSKNIASKDTKGSISNYKLMANTTFVIDIDGQIKSISFNEDFIMKNLADSFEKNNYEKTIKQNFSNTITEKLMLEISSIE